MSGEHLPAGIDLRADRLRHAENDAADQRAPHAAEAAHDHRLEAEDQARRPDRRIEIGPDRQQHAGDRHHRERERHREREDVTVVEADELRHVLVVGGGAERAPDRRAVEQPLQAGDHRDRERELDERQRPDREAGAELDAVDLDRAGLQPAAVGREQFQEPVLDDHRQAERHQERRQQIVAQGAVEQAALQRVADQRHQRHDHRERGERIDAERLGGDQRQIGGEHDEIAVRDIDEPHHPEDERQAGGEHGVEAADQHALQDDVDPLHRQTPK